MKRIRIQKIMAALLAAVVAFGMLGIGTGSAYAASHKWALYIDEVIYAGYIGTIFVYDMNDINIDAKVTKVTPSKEGIVEVKKKTSGGYYLEGKKPGDAKITVSYKTPQGKTGTTSATVQVKPYPKPLKSIYVNGKKVKLGKHKYDYYKRTKKTSIKIKMATQNGWKISRVYAIQTTKSGKETECKVTKKMLKNGKAIKFSKKYSKMKINVTMTKGFDEISYYFYIYR